MQFLTLTLAYCCLTASAAPPALDLSVMSFNIKQQNPRNEQAEDEPTHWEQRKPLVFEIIRDHAPDIIGVQEAYLGQLDDLMGALPKFAAVGEGRGGGTKDEHCSILYRKDRFRADASGTFWLSDTPEKRSKTWGHFYLRICTWVRLVDKESGQGLYVFNTHLDHKSQEAREKSARLIARRIHEREHKEPYLLTGDFNAGELNPVIVYLKGDGEEKPPVAFADSFRMLHAEAKGVGTGNRFEGKTDGEKIDYIFVAPETKVLKADIIRTHLEDIYPSDHYPISAKVKLTGTRP